MSDAPASGGVGLEVIAPGGARNFVQVEETPFYIGRGGDTKRHLQIADPRISRQCASIISEGGQYYLEDCGQRHGIFVNGERVTRRVLNDGDVITFGIPDFYELVFRSSFSRNTTLLPDLLSRMEHISTVEGSPVGLHKLNLLLEATTLLHSQPSARRRARHHAGPRHCHHRRGPRPAAGDRIPRDRSGCARARSRGGMRLAPGEVAPSQTALRQALEKQSEHHHRRPRAGGRSIYRRRKHRAQRLRAMVVIPLYAMPRASRVGIRPFSASAAIFSASCISIRAGPPHFRSSTAKSSMRSPWKPPAFWTTRAWSSANGNASAWSRRSAFARDIQQALLPRGFRDFPHLTVSGVNLPCLSVGGDYFDVFPMKR